MSSLSVNGVSAQQEGEEISTGQDRIHIGTLKCAACHFQQFRTWRESKHAHAFDILPAKYRADATCLKCHATGYGHATGYKGAATPNLAQVSCEACHGPGSEHAEMALGFLEKEITTADEARIRGAIVKMLPNACMECHVTAAHKPHPPYDKE
jgi:hypothetical protein